MTTTTRQHYWGDRKVRVIGTPYRYPQGNVWGYGSDLDFVRIEIQHDPQRLFKTGERVEALAFSVRTE